MEEVAARTRIAVRFIRLIEENRFDQLPNVVSAKGFLRSYARCIGLDETAVLDRFSGAGPETEPPPAEVVEEKVPAYIERKQPDRLPFPLWAALAVIGVILLFLAVAFLMPKGREPVSPPPHEIPAPEGGGPSEPPSPIPAPEGEGAPSQAPVAPAPASLQEASVVPPSRVLMIEAVEPSWVHVTIDGTETKEALLKPSEKVRWEAKEKFVLTVGNAGGVRVSLDGQDLGPLGPTGRVVKREITVRQ